MTEQEEMLDSAIRLLRTGERHNIDLALQIISSGVVEFSKDLKRSISEATIAIAREFVLENCPRHINPFDFVAGVFENYDSQVKGLVCNKEKTQYGYAKDFFTDSLNSFFKLSVEIGGVSIMHGSTAMLTSYNFLAENWIHVIYTQEFMGAIWK